MKYINTEKFSFELREKAIDFKRKAILLTNFSGSKQEVDFTEPANCNGFGRVRHFKLGTGFDWPFNPLPILPAAKALEIASDVEIRAQVFQSAVCNWRCWYCFVDFDLLVGNKKFSSFLNCDDMLELYLAESNPPPMFDLTGGQPDLTPEWVPWMMEALKNRNLDKKIFLWSDDNLSNDYLWRFLDDKQLELLQSYPLYSRVCCFKGIDEISFSQNTKANPELFNNQFTLCKRLVELNLDLYCYVTLTANCNTDFNIAIPKFIDNLQLIHELLPLRVVPLRVFDFTPTKTRMKDSEKDLMTGQFIAKDVWIKEIEKRFSTKQLSLPITEISIRHEFI